MPDAIDELAKKIRDDYFSHGLNILHEVIAKHLRAANVQLPPQPPKPGSLWEHRETGERRFVTSVVPSRVNFSAIPEWLVAASFDNWHTWAANATCICEGVG